MVLRVAVAGAGDLAKYMVEELLAAGHQVVVLSRSPKPWFDRPDIAFHTTDYSVPSLVPILADCDAVVSTILDYVGTASIAPHLNLLAACQQSARCKKFIPSEYGGDTDQFADVPLFYKASHQPVRDALAAQSDVQWTLICIGWLMDYLAPPAQRYIRNIGPFHPIDFAAGTARIPGTGDEPVCFVSARDLARATAALVAADRWDKPTTFITAERTTWNAIVQLLAARGHKLAVSHIPTEQLDRDAADGDGTSEKAVAAQFGLWSSSGACGLPPAQLARQRTQFYPDVKMRTVAEFLDDAEKDLTKEAKI